MTNYHVENDALMLVEHAPTQDALSELLMLSARGADSLSIRAGIEKLEKAMADLPPVEQPVTHHFAPGLYKREIFNPKGSLIVTKIHKLPNFSFLMKGKLAVLTESGTDVVEAPAMFTTQAGTKRLIFSLDDTVFVTVHPNHDDTHDLDVLESRIIAQSFDELEVIGEIARPALGGAQ